MHVCAELFSRVQLFEILWTVAHQAPLFTGFSRQEYWSGLPFPSPGDLPDPGVEPKSPASLVLAGRFFTTEQLGKPLPEVDQTQMSLPMSQSSLLPSCAFAITISKMEMDQ